MLKIISVVKSLFNKSDFERASKMKIEDIEELNNLPSKKSLIDFDIEITNQQIKFTNLQNRKSIHIESINNILKFSNFYKKYE